MTPFEEAQLQYMNQIVDELRRISRAINDMRIEAKVS